MWSKTFWTALVVVLAAIIGARYSRIKQAGVALEGPVARLQWTTWDFGSVRSGQLLSVSCVVRNEGNRRLIVRQLNHSCGCNRSDAGPMVIEPGSSVDLATTIPTHDLRGPIQVDLRYSTSDPQTPQFSLVVRADVRAN